MCIVYSLCKNEQDFWDIQYNVIQASLSSERRERHSGHITVIILIIISQIPHI